MSEFPDAFNSKTRKANKQHKCCECGCVIEKGEQYQYSSGIWDHDAYSFKQCINCHEIMNAATYSAANNQDEAPCFTGLLDYFRNYQCRGFTGREWLEGMAAQIDIKTEKLNKLLCV